MGGIKNKNLQKAKDNVNNEFYTLLDDIVSNISKFKSALKGKRVYCNCDHPIHSNFVHYLKSYFHCFELEELVSTHFVDGKQDLFAEQTGIQNPHFGVRVNSNGEGLFEIEGNGSFDSEFCVDLLEKCDVVITNPPFSKSKELLDLICLYKKDFILINHLVFFKERKRVELLQEGKMLCWSNSTSPSMSFKTPDNNITKIPALWCSSLTPDEPVIINYDFKCKYKPKKYPVFDNRKDVICINKFKETPIDYPGLMGVPVSLFRFYDPKKIKIQGIIKNPVLDKKQLFIRIIISWVNNEIH